MNDLDPGAHEYAQLMTALATTDPVCLDDPRYTLDPDQLHHQELHHLRALCHACPLEQLCDAYATTAQPTGGLWAGRHYTEKRRR